MGEGERPNILLILSDQHNPNVLGCAGDPIVRTPNLDGLASQGVRFTAAYCNSPLCVPSRMSFLTACHPKDIKVWTNSCILGSDIPTFAHALGASGYETVLCGRMHFVGIDQRHGFEKRLVGDVTAMYLGGQGPDLGDIPLATTGQTKTAVTFSGPGQTAYQAFDIAVTETAIQFLRNRRDDRPFCLVVGYVLPHCPYIAPKPLFEHYYERVTVPPPSNEAAKHPAVCKWQRHQGLTGLEERDIRRARAAYYGLVEFLDRLIGRLLDALDELRIWERTVILYTSDHGDMIGDHGLWGKMTFYEGSVRVPLIFSWKGWFPGGKVCHRVVSLVDVTATLLDLAKAPPLPFMAGRSFRPLLEDPESEGGWEDIAFSELCVLPDFFARMVRQGRWKLILFPGYDRPQLFDLQNDPEEWHDLGDDPSHQDIVTELKGKVREGWEPQKIRTILERRQRRKELLIAWCQKVNPPDPDHWKTPPAANRFPEG